MNFPRKRISIIDCAIQEPSTYCFNKLVNDFPAIQFFYHAPPQNGIGSLKMEDKTDGYIVFGSYSNVCDRLTWHDELASFLDQKLRERIPVFGICFAHQLMASFYGGSVERMSEKLSGSREIQITSDHKGYKEGEKFEYCVTHQYEVATISPEMSVLATSSQCKYEGLFHNSLPLVTFQGHPEASEYFIAKETHVSEQTQEKILAGGQRIMAKFIDQIIGAS